MAVKVLTFCATAVPIVNTRKTVLAPIHPHRLPTILPIGPHMKLENPIVSRTPALDKLMVDADESRSSEISLTTEKSDVELKVAANAVNDRQKRMRDLRHNGNEKYGEGRVDVLVKLSSNGVFGENLGVGEADESGVSVDEDIPLTCSCAGIGGLGYVVPTIVSVLAVAISVLEENNCCPSGSGGCIFVFWYVA